MASLEDATAPTGQSQRRPDQHGARGRGRGRARGDRGNGIPHQEGSDREATHREGRGGRRGRGPARGEHMVVRQTSNAMTESELSERFAQLKASNGTPRQTPHNVNQTQTSADAPDGDDVEAEVCFICASPVVHNSVAPCNHRTCHICALRMRALYKTKDCAHCRVSYTTYATVPISVRD
jgi:hypothetical protein